MEYVKGETLREYLVRTRKPLSEKHIAEIEGIIKAAHERGLVHGDIHIKNIIVRPNGRLALIDWGSVRASSRIHDLSAFEANIKTYTRQESLDILLREEARQSGALIGQAVREISVVEGPRIDGGQIGAIALVAMVAIVLVGIIFGRRKPEPTHSMKDFDASMERLEKMMKELKKP